MGKNPYIKAAALLTAFLFLVSVVIWLLYPKSADHTVPDGLLKLDQLTNGQPVNFEMTSIDNEKVISEKLLGKVVIVNFWASWCEPCVKEFPSMLKLVRQFGGRIQIVAVSGDFNMDDLTNFLKAFGVSKSDMTVVWDQGNMIAKKFGTEKLPESYLIGADGKLIRKIVGVEDWANDDAIQFFEALVKDL
jgi:cytochrome c biogenesis protein CcmG/thiol:disulfide interchange protein DsbE